MLQSLLIKNALLISTEDNSITKKDLLIRQGKINQVSEKIEGDTSTTEVIDVEEKYIMPGLIDCHTHVGIIEEATGKIGVDNNETSDPVTPHMRGIDAIHPFDLAFLDAVKSGITTVMTGPGSNNAVGGLSAAIKTHGKIIDEMIIRNPVGLKIALGENPMSTYGKMNKAPVTRMATAALIRELFMRTQDYMVQKENNKIKERDLQLESVIPLLKGEISLRAHAHRADDIVTACRIAEEFGISKLVIEHGTEANLVKEYLKEREVPVAFGPMLTPRLKIELKKRDYTCALDLIDVGVKVALITDHPYNLIDQLRIVAALAISEGLSEADAMKCVTTYPAEILECHQRIGKLQEGYDADLVVFDGMPFDINSKVLLTIINGKVVYRR
ncbi:amidohydrolase [Clostridium aceticum]|uniref:Amidohydrolase n=1 Tax=Clostridium aceticum TaxID=84022 RepID=A0A0D8IAQ7_9CLOT|nr:amidohydrolase [Clostridium aceticum]AKL95951.1 amidohydrolase [Clostridium aceticum]KJF27149.1 amidohydrolase [Clostridium aceticum]